jgi:predicted PurR-regulated permease PerM
MNRSPKPFTFDRVVRILIGLTVIILLFLLVSRLSSVLLPFLIAWLLAYLLQPFVIFFQYKLKLRNRMLSIFATLSLFFGTLIGTVSILAPIVYFEIQKLSQLIVSYTQNLDVNTFIPAVWQHEIKRYLSHLDFQTIMKDQNVIEGIKKLAPQLWNFVNGSLDFVLGFSVVVIVFLYLVFILQDYEKISAGCVEIIPPKYKKLVTEVFIDLKFGMNRYFRGQALIALIVGVLFIIGFSIIQLPLAIVLGLLIGMLTMVPYLKALAVIPCAVMGLLQSVETGQSYLSVLLGIAIVFVLIQILEDMLLTPKIMGKVTGLNPAVILLSLSIWGSLMGVVGMIIALPLTTLIISYYKRFVLDDIHIDETLQAGSVESLPDDTNK